MDHRMDVRRLCVAPKPTIDINVIEHHIQVSAV